MHTDTERGEIQQLERREEEARQLLEEFEQHIAERIRPEIQRVEQNGLATVQRVQDTFGAELQKGLDDLNEIVNQRFESTEREIEDSRENVTNTFENRIQQLLQLFHEENEMRNSSLNHLQISVQTLKTMNWVALTLGSLGVGLALTFLVL